MATLEKNSEEHFLGFLRLLVKVSQKSGIVIKMKVFVNEEFLKVGVKGQVGNEVWKVLKDNLGT